MGSTLGSCANADADSVAAIGALRLLAVQSHLLQSRRSKELGPTREHTGSPERSDNKLAYTYLLSPQNTKGSCDSHARFWRASKRGSRC